MRNDSPDVLSLVQRCGACGSTVNLLETSPNAPNLDDLSLDTTPFSESFSGLIDALDEDENHDQYDAKEQRLHEPQYEEISYNVEQYSDVNELDPDWDDDDVAEVMILSPKPRQSFLPTIREEQDALSIASKEAHCYDSVPEISLQVTLADFELLHTTEYPMRCRKRSSTQVYAIKTLGPALHFEKHVMEAVRDLQAPFLEQLQWCLPGAGEGEEEMIHLVLDCNHRESLSSLLKAGPITATEAYFYACELVDALSSLHSADIVHRDLTPFNIFIDNNGHILLSNFSNATILRDGRQSSLPMSSAIEYQAPEILLGWTHDAAVDCWSFGLVLHFLLTGDNPVIRGRDIRVLHNEVLCAEICLAGTVGGLARDLIQKCLENNPAIRYRRLKDHFYFNAVDWNGVHAGELAPPNYSSTPSPKRPLSQDFPLPPTSRLSHYLDTSLDCSFTVHTASKAIPTIPRLERLDGPAKPLIRVRSSCSMEELRARNQARRLSLNIPPSNSLRVPHHRPSRSIHDAGALSRSHSFNPEPATTYSTRLSLQIQTPDLLPAIFRPTTLENRVSEEEESAIQSPTISSPTVCEPSPHQRMARFWEEIDAEGRTEQRRNAPVGPTMELRDAVRLALPCPPLPKSTGRVKKRRSLGPLGLQSEKRDSILSTSPQRNKLRKMRRPLSTPLLRKRSSEPIVNLPAGVEQIGQGIGFNYKIPIANGSKASICPTTKAGRLMRSVGGILRKVKSTPKFPSSSPAPPSGVGGRRARGPPARIQTGSSRVASPLHSPALSDGPLTPESIAFPPMPEIVGDPFAKDDTESMIAIGEVNMGGVRLVPVEQKFSSSPSMDSFLMAGRNNL
uniref:AGC/AKT protein kinase n=1 Tax=Mycena chlorophos TaxID=658473 RepID=A0ABQ0LYX1_MYCCL|nr:AGC/AKT protein kinase [Mycena chlorophos]